MWSAGSFCGRLCTTEASGASDWWRGQQHIAELRWPVCLLQEMHGAVFTVEHWSANAAAHQNISEISAWICQQSPRRQLAKVCINIVYYVNLYVFTVQMFETLCSSTVVCSQHRWLMCLCVSMPSNFFSNRYFSYSISLILIKLVTHDLCANMQKRIVEQISKFTFLNFWQMFFEILHLDFVSAAGAVELSRLTGLTSFLWSTSVKYWCVQRIRGFSMTMRYINRHYLSIYLSQLFHVLKESKI